jgi:NADH-quinone oxidoreductase subunit H
MLSRRVFGAVPLWLGALAIIALLLIILIAVNIGGIIAGVESAVTFVFDPASRDITVIECSDSSGCSLWHPILYSALLLALVVTGFAYTTLLERKFIAWFQHRVGPNRVGPWGLLQPAADGVKLIFKEDITPTEANRPVYLMAPVLKVVPTLIVLAVIPLGPPIVLPWFDGNWYRVPLHVADLNVGVLWLLAITSIGTYGVVLAGWASSNKYSMLGGLRASAQMISYELSMGLMLAVPVLIVGSMSIRDIIDAQGAVPILGWFVFQNPLAAAILTFALIAEVNRAPFDLPEAEQELTAGYMTEYSGMKFALFMMAEYLGMIAISLIAVSTFFGGYHFFLVDSIPILGPLVMIGKVVALLIGMIWLRATLPRIRYDRLMSFGWKVMLPLALLAVSWTAIAVVIGDEFGQTGYMAFSTVVIAAVAVVGFILLRRRAADEVAEDDDLENDPMITGEQRGLGYAVIQVVGGIIAGPMLLYNWTVNLLDRLSTMVEESATEEQDEDAAEEESESAGSLPSRTGGN